MSIQQEDIIFTNIYVPNKEAPTYKKQGFPGCLVVNNLSVVQELWCQYLSQEDPLEKEMETHSSILAWKIPWTEEPGRLQVAKELDMT